MPQFHNDLKLKMDEYVHLVYKPAEKVSSSKFQVPSFKNKGFTLIEILVSVSIVAILSAIVLFSVTNYLNKGKDAAVRGNLATLIPAAEIWYDNHENSYFGFCDGPVASSILADVPSSVKPCYSPGSGNAWRACAHEFINNTKAFCVDSTGVKKEIEVSECTDLSTATACP